MCADVLLCLLDPFWVKLSGQPRNNDAWGRNCRGVSGSNKWPEDTAEDDIGWISGGRGVDFLLAICWTLK